MAAPNVFQELKNALTELKTFLHGPEVTTVQKAIKALAAIVPQINDVVNDIINLLNKLDTEIQNLNIPAIEGLDKVTTFIGSMKAVLEAAKAVLPNESSKIDDVITGTDLVAGLPSVNDIKGEIHTLIADVVGVLNGFKG